MTNRQTIPLRDFFRNPEKTGFQISPTGKYIAFLQPYQHRLNIVVQERSTPENLKQVTTDTNRDIYSYLWKTDTTLLYLQDSGGDENHHLYVTTVENGEVRDLTPFDNVQVQIIDELKDYPDEIIIGLNNRNPQVFDVYRLHIASGTLELLYENPGTITSFMTDHNGQLRLLSSTDGVTTTILVRQDTTQPFTPLLTTNFKEMLFPLFFTFDNTNVYALSNLGRDKVAIVEFDIATGKELRILFEHDEVDVDALRYSHKRKVLTMASFVQWKRERFFFDDTMRALYTDIEQQLQGHEVTLPSATDDETLFIVRTYSDRSLGAYYLYNAVDKALVKLAEISPWLQEEQLAPMQPISFTSRDGLVLHGYLTLPLHTPAANLPIVINPHGGPWARDTWAFNPEVQFLANRGYGVLQINFRGSIGYGKAFWESSFKQWGKNMQNDISDGVQWLVDTGVANPKRVAIYGGSYGGYATLAGLTFTPELYACGIDYVGVSNLFTFLESLPPYWQPFLEMMYEMVGHPENDKEQLYAASPLFHANNIKVPVLVAQGANDPRVKIQESDQIVQALRDRAIETTYIVKNNEGHGFSNEENRFEFYEAMEAFLANHLQ